MSSKDVNESVAQRIRELHEKSGGNLEPDAVVEDAREKNSPLHELFEWNDRKAAAIQRLDRAREIIRSVTIVYETSVETIRAPAYVKNPATSKGYVSIARLSTDEDRAREALVHEFSMVRGALVRARLIARALDLEGDVEKLLAGVADLHSRVMPPPEARQ